MNPVNRGIRNAFRNGIRTTSIVVILGLAMGLALAMLIANKAVTQKIETVKASVGNTITIAPAGFSGFSQVNNSLTTTQLAKVSSLDHVTGVAESLTDRLTKIGSTQPSFGGGSSSSTKNSNATTSLTSPITFNFGSGSGGGGGGHFFVNGGGSLPTNFSPPIEITGTNDPLYVDSTNLTLSKGSNIDATKDQNDALISATMASKNNLNVGSTFTAYNTTMMVSGIFSTSNQSIGNTLIVSLPTEQSLSGQSGDVTSAIAQVDSLDNLSSVTSNVKSVLGSSADITSSVQEADSAVQPLNSVKSVSLYSLIGAIVAGSVIILLTMVMIVRERTREIGVIKAIGGSNAKIAFQFMAEAVTLTMAGAVIGILLGAVAANPITNALVSSSTTSSTTTTTQGPTGGFGGRGGFGGGGGAAAGGGGARFITGGHGAAGFLKDNFSNIHAAVGWSIIIYGLLSALVIALVGSGVVSLFISKIRPAEVMRSE